MMPEILKYRFILEQAEPFGTCLTYDPGNYEFGPGGGMKRGWT